MGLGSPIDVLQLFPLHEIIDRFCHKNLWIVGCILVMTIWIVFAPMCAMDIFSSF
jgi:hypothetical protein